MIDFALLGCGPIGAGHANCLAKPPGARLAAGSDVLGRCERGKGEVDYPAIARELEQLEHKGTVGSEAFAFGNDDLALSRFRETSTVEAEPSLA